MRLFCLRSEDTADADDDELDNMPLTCLVQKNDDPSGDCEVLDSDNELSEAEQEWRAVERSSRSVKQTDGSVKETDGFVYANRTVLGRIVGLPSGSGCQTVAVFCNHHAGCHCNVVLNGHMTRATLPLWLRSQCIFNSATPHLKDLLCLVYKLMFVFVVVFSSCTLSCTHSRIDASMQKQIRGAGRRVFQSA